jgi:hypothetical protein
MRRYKLTLTRKEIAKRLAKYPPRLLRELRLVLDDFEYKHSIQYLYEPSPEEREAVHKELLIAQYQELGASKSEIVNLLKRAGLTRLSGR